MATCSAASHAAAKASAELFATLIRVGEQHIPELGVHLELRNCPVCSSTLARPLPGHVEEDEWDEPTPVCDVTTPACPAPREPVEERAGYVPAVAA